MGSFLFTQLLKYKCKKKLKKRRKRKKEEEKKTVQRRREKDSAHGAIFLGQMSHHIGLFEEYIHREFFPFFGKPIGNFIEQA